MSWGSKDIGIFTVDTELCTD